MTKQKNAPKTNAAPVASYKHDNKRARIPTQEESVMLPRKEKQPVRKSYAYDPSLDPQLVWAGKQEQGAEFGVPTVPIYVQEKIAPEALIARLKGNITQDIFQPSLFGVETVHDQFHKAVDFYKHEDNWQNRMILGDSLLVMNSLLEKEGMRGKVQMVYIDPPYGIKFGSNWQVSTKNREVKDKLEDFIRQPEQVKAFRDTWELGVHSYLSYLRDRIILARELLTESGSCFVQISDENLNYVKDLMIEVFGINNYIDVIPFWKTTGLQENFLASVCDYIVWFGKNKEKTKYRQLYFDKGIGDEGSDMYRTVELQDKSTRPITRQELADGKLPVGTRLFRADNLQSQGNPFVEFLFNNKKFTGRWKTNLKGMQKLGENGRIIEGTKTLSYKRYLDDFPVFPITNLWTDTGTGGDYKIYVVQTSVKPIRRCILMTTDPGDVVLDPTCGSGTTAFVAEEWGRRWITIDSSRVALALARTRLMTALFPYFAMKEIDQLSSGFIYKQVRRVTLGSIANDEEPEIVSLADQPIENKSITRVTGPFTVESLSPHRVSDEQEMLSTERYVNIIIENLRKAGVQTGQKGARLEFLNLDILGGAVEIQARGEYKTATGTATAAVAIGPEFGSVDDDFIRDAVGIAKRFASLLVVAAPSFDASAHSVETEMDGLTIMKVKINPDLSMGDLLKKTGSGNLFLAFGQPDVSVTEQGETIIVEVLGVDVYDPVKGELRSSGSGNLEHDIAAWFIDSNYSGDAFFVTQAYFLGSDKPYEKLKKALKADINEELWEELYSTRSRPFPKPKSGKIAVKVINHYGDEVMKVIEVFSPDVNPPTPAALTDYGMYKCSLCGKFVTGFSKDTHEHEGSDFKWTKISG